MVRDLVTLRQHLLVHIRQVRAGIPQRRTDSEERDLNLLLLDNSHDLLGKLWVAVVDSKGKRVRTGAGEDQWCSREL